MREKLALCVVLTVLLTGCDDDLADLYEAGELADVVELEDERPAMRSDTALPEPAPAPLVATLPPAATDAERRATEPAQRRSLRVFCSPTAKSTFGHDLEKSFERAHPGIDLVLLEDRDRNCIGNVIMGNAPAAIVGVPLSPTENQHGLAAKVLGYRIVVAIVHRNNPVTSLFDGPLQKVLDGRIGSWGELGWLNYQIQPAYQVPTGASDPAARLLQMTDKAAQIAALLPDGDRVVDYVAREPRALGLATRSRLRAHKGQVRFLEINEVQPTVPNYLRGAYALGCTFRLVHARDRRRQLAELLTFLDGNETKQLLEQHLTLR
ncbi:MAG: type 2 periplasmic-binding domain-containing protein [Planctomycetota bacterium]|jgi:DNA-binding transcriptional LysR family regulator